MPGKVCIIGSGLAGASAAAMARRAGADVIILSKGPAATSFSSGALDLCGDPCAVPERPAESCPDVAQNISRLNLREPLHPYSLLAQAAERPAEAVLTLIKEAMSLLFPEGGLVELAGSEGKAVPCFTSLGTVKFSSFFPKHTALPGAPGMVRPAALGIRGLSDFEPSAWAKVASENAERLGQKLIASAAWLRLGKDQERGAPEIAAAIERDPDAFVDAVNEAAARVNGATSLILAPVLPAKARSELIARISKATGLLLYEPLSLPPSVPGLRLSLHLDQRLGQLGAQMLRAEVTGFEADGPTIKALIAERPEGKERIEADAFVLASGKFLGGGIVKERALRERVFNLTVFMRGRACGEFFTEKALGLRVTERHALFEAGVRVDGALRPLDRDGNPAFANLFAAGAVLSGHNYIHDQTGAGVALATGARAGMNATG